MRKDEQFGVNYRSIWATWFFGSLFSDTKIICSLVGLTKWLVVDSFISAEGYIPKLWYFLYNLSIFSFCYHAIFYRNQSIGFVQFKHSFWNSWLRLHVHCSISMLCVYIFPAWLPCVFSSIHFLITTNHVPAAHHICVSLHLPFLYLSWMVKKPRLKRKIATFDLSGSETMHPEVFLHISFCIWLFLSGDGSWQSQCCKCITSASNLDQGFRTFLAGHIF